MQIVGNQIDARDYGVGESVQFDIVQSAEMFNLLSNGLYKDKITAVIRELSTNAYDSHVEAGRVSTPFEVKLPNHRSPNFSIRDFGTGMSQEKLVRLYTSYGKSNRSQSNEFIGGMGLGSKAPFCYTDAFVVTSFYSGMKYIYTAAKDEDGKPNLIHLLTEPTTEPNGVEISLAVKNSDFDEFNRKAIVVYKWFKTTPTISGGVNNGYRVSKENYITSGSNNGFYGVTGTGESRVIMGNIAYKIDPVHFADNPNKYSSWYSNDANMEVKLLQVGMDVEFPIGSIAIDAGREGLQYTKSVIRTIKDRLKGVADLIRADVEKQIKDAKTLWDAKVAYNKIYQASSLRNILNSVDVKWNGEDVTRNIDLSNIGSKQISVKTIGQYRNTRHDTWYITPHDNVGFLINDMEKGGFTAAERYRTEKKLECVYLIRLHTSYDSNDPKTGAVITNVVDTKATRKELVEELGIDDAQFVHTSSLPKPPRKKGGKRETVFEMLMNKVVYNFAAAEVDFEDGGVYAELNHGYYIKPGRKEGTQALFNTLKQAEALGIKLPESVYLIKTVSIKKYRADDEWTELHDYIKGEMAKLAASAVLKKLIEDSSFSNLSDYEQLQEVLKNSKVKLPVNADGTPHEIQAFADLTSTLAKNEQKVRDSYSKYKNVAYFFGIDLVDSVPGQTIAAKFSALKDKYKMLDFLDLMRYNYVKTKSSLFVEFLLK